MKEGCFNLPAILEVFLFIDGDFGVISPQACKVSQIKNFQVFKQQVKMLPMDKVLETVSPCL